MIPPTNDNATGEGGVSGQHRTDESGKHTTRPEALEEFRRCKLTYDFYIRHGGSAEEIDDALAALNSARAELQFLGECGR